MPDNIDMYEDVLAFHRKFGCHIGRSPAVPDADTVRLRLALIEEEHMELISAIQDQDLPGVADSIVDKIYVLVGTAIAYGIDIRPVWVAVQAANMAKEGGGKRADGKVTKPSTWTPPDVAGIIAAQMPEGA